MTKRNIIAEIQDKNIRASAEYLTGHAELFSLEHAFEKLDGSEKTLLALLVMGTASCIEVSTRAAIKGLIDSGHPYLDRAESFKENIKFDFALTRALSSGQITFGDLISHSLPVSRVDHISSHFEVLFRSEFRDLKSILAEVKVYVEPDDDELLGNEAPGTTQRKAPLLITDADMVLKDVGSIFETRHLIAHEAYFNVVGIEEVRQLLKSARQFVDALYEIVEQTLNTGRSRSGFGESIQFRRDASDIWTAAREMQASIPRIIESGKPDHEDLKQLFDKSVESFDKYYETEEAFRLASTECYLEMAC